MRGGLQATAVHLSRSGGWPGRPDNREGRGAGETIRHPRPRAPRAPPRLPVQSRTQKACHRPRARLGSVHPEQVHMHFRRHPAAHVREHPPVSRFLVELTARPRSGVNLIPLHSHHHPHSATSTATSCSSTASCAPSPTGRALVTCTPGAPSRSSALKPRGPLTALQPTPCASPALQTARGRRAPDTTTARASARTPPVPPTSRPPLPATGVVDAGRGDGHPEAEAASEDRASAPGGENQAAVQGGGVLGGLPYGLGVIRSVPAAAQRCTSARVHP
ncbi:hypothetical protein SAMN00790413_06453 [Deinococcus hopiensis KR-140]|uniref:Uncharacterized protein n=1 Tax=Deinococcus hopiensis KR-140 TaxID=695939 RepID=A0A1W1VVG6_9DEIO|nr:hypothetical protein SAMN00790413_06453 [Deinococcus hopiensis KR-140]